VDPACCLYEIGTALWMVGSCVWKEMNDVLQFAARGAVVEIHKTCVLPNTMLLQQAFNIIF
jgi:hypothetical protein